MHLKVLLDAAVHLDELVLDVEALVGVDVNVILSLCADVKALLADVQVSLKALLALKAGEYQSALSCQNQTLICDSEVLVAIAAELKLVLALIVPITAPIVKLALAVVAHVHVDLPDVVVKITACVGAIADLTSGLSGLVGPVLKLIH